MSQEKLQKQSQEAARRDEQLVVLKVELATLQEKHRLIQDEVIQRFLINEYGYKQGDNEMETLKSAGKVTPDTCEFCLVLILIGCECIFIF